LIVLHQKLHNLCTDWKYNGAMMTSSAILMAQGLNGQVWLVLSVSPNRWRRTRSPLGRHTSVFQAEVFALLTCVKLESLLFRNNCSIAICSDSLAAIKAVSAYRFGS